MKAINKAEELIEVFSNDNTNDSERKAIEHAIYHVEEIIVIAYDQATKNYYKEVLNHLKQIK
jgi:cobyrinic acid a,c-diamide synthase